MQTCRERAARHGRQISSATLVRVSICYSGKWPVLAFACRGSTKAHTATPSGSGAPARKLQAHQQRHLSSQAHIQAPKRTHQRPSPQVQTAAASAAACSGTNAQAPKQQPQQPTTTTTTTFCYLRLPKTALVAANASNYKLVCCRFAASTLKSGPTTTATATAASSSTTT